MHAGVVWHTIVGFGSNFDLSGLLEYVASWPSTCSSHDWREIANHDSFLTNAPDAAANLFRSDGGKCWAPLADMREANRYFKEIKDTGVLGLFPFDQPLQGIPQPAIKVCTAPHPYGYPADIQRPTLLGNMISCPDNTSSISYLYMLCRSMLFLHSMAWLCMTLSAGNRNTILLTESHAGIQHNLICQVAPHANGNPCACSCSVVCRTLFDIGPTSHQYWPTGCLCISCLIVHVWTREYMYKLGCFSGGSDQ